MGMAESLLWTRDFVRLPCNPGQSVDPLQYVTMRYNTIDLMFAPTPAPPRGGPPSSDVTDFSCCFALHTEEHRAWLQATGTI